MTWPIRRADNDQQDDWVDEIAATLVALWVWDRIAKRYRSIATGRFMPRRQILDYVAQSVATTANAADILAGYVAQGVTAPAEFAVLFREQIKGEYIRQYLLGRGGLYQMGAADWGRIGAMLKRQYGYLDGFVDDMVAGGLSEAQIRARAQMYIESARQGFERAKNLNAREAGMTEELWVLDPNAEHCPDCEELAARGWQPIGTFPMPGAGDTQCLTNCRCFLQYRNAEGVML